LQVTISQSDDTGEINKRLVAAEKAWIQLRDTSCSLESAQMLGGTGEGLVAISCLVRAQQAH
jgi:uncharacterized protein YecT (DUF1311 family)